MPHKNFGHCTIFLIQCLWFSLKYSTQSSDVDILDPCNLIYSMPDYSIKAHTLPCAPGLEIYSQFCCSTDMHESRMNGEHRKVNFGVFVIPVHIDSIAILHGILTTSAASMPATGHSEIGSNRAFSFGKILKTRQDSILVGAPKVALSFGCIVHQGISENKVDHHSDHQRCNNKRLPHNLIPLWAQKAACNPNKSIDIVPEKGSISSDYICNTIPVIDYFESSAESTSLRIVPDNCR